MQAVSSAGSQKYEQEQQVNRRSIEDHDDKHIPYTPYKEGRMAVQSRSFGKTENGIEVTVFSITNGNGTECSFIDLGAAWVTMKVKDRDGKFADVVIG